jgi:CDGSH iron-sulfur domain-containing protein 3
MEKKQTKCTVVDNGPYIVTGDFKMMDARGNEVRVTDPTYLCRCGHSKNKPFCDGMHKEMKFQG